MAASISANFVDGGGWIAVGCMDNNTQSTGEDSFRKANYVSALVIAAHFGNGLPPSIRFCNLNIVVAHALRITVHRCVRVVFAQQVTREDEYDF